MSDTQKHTPTPWEAQYDDGDLTIGFRLPTGGFVPLAWMLDGGVIREKKGTLLPVKENAEFIVRAVNSHADLLAAVKELTAANRSGVNRGNAQAMGEAAIARAEGRA